MKLPLAALFAIPALIWGSTFFVIKFQLGMVDPTWSVSYRFMLAGILLLIYCAITQKNLSFSWLQHACMLLQGVLLFGLNYLLVYIAEQELISALVAIAFSTIIFMNILFGTLLLGKKSEKTVYSGAALGIVGTFLLFRNDLIGLEVDELPMLHLVVCFLSVMIASLGNITSSYNQAQGLPVVQTNAFGMFYGGGSIAIVAWIAGKPMVFDTSAGYILSLLYLTILGSIVAFGSYLTLIGRIGADKAAYVLIMIPIVAVCLSVAYEGYAPGVQVFISIALILVGNLLVVRKRRTAEAVKDVNKSA